MAKVATRVRYDTGKADHEGKLRDAIDRADMFRYHTGSICAGARRDAGSVLDQAALVDEEIEEHGEILSMGEICSVPSKIGRVDAGRSDEANRVLLDLLNGTRQDEATAMAIVKERIANGELPPWNDEVWRTRWKEGS